MYDAIKVYKEVGYKYMLMPDHVPEINAKDPKMTAFSYCCLLYTSPSPRDTA